MTGPRKAGTLHDQERINDADERDLEPLVLVDLLLDFLDHVVRRKNLDDQRRHAVD
jgi:hypothetical protein